MEANLFQGFCPRTELPVPSVLLMLQGNKPDSSTDRSLPHAAALQDQLRTYKFLSSWALSMVGQAGSLSGRMWGGQGWKCCPRQCPLLLRACCK